MKLVKGLLVGIVSLSVLAACDQNMYGGAGPKQSVGTLGGAVAGGLLGSQAGGGSGRLWATGAGVLLGAIAGSEIGKSLDRADRAYMAQTTYRALESAPSGHPARWINPEYGPLWFCRSAAGLSAGRAAMSRIHPDDQCRRKSRAGIWNGVPPAGRFLADS